MLGRKRLHPRAFDQCCDLGGDRYRIHHFGFSRSDELHYLCE